VTQAEEQGRRRIRRGCKFIYMWRGNKRRRRRRRRRIPV
jgi:hypothetical protein